jgi:hypothetical protein
MKGNGQFNCLLTLLTFTVGCRWVLHAFCELEAVFRLVHEAKIVKSYYAPDATLATVATPVITAATALS